MQLRPANLYSTIKLSRMWMEVPLLLSFNLLLVASAWVSINVPFSPVPITGQTLEVLLTVAILPTIWRFMGQRK